MSVTQRKLLMNAYFHSQFEYSPLVWMKHSRILNNSINGLRKKVLRSVYSDFSSPFSEPFMKDKSVTIHQINLQPLAFEMPKVKNNLATKIMKNIFSFKALPYSLKNNSGSTKTALYGPKTISSFRPKIWEILSPELRNSKSFDAFKKKI